MKMSELGLVEYFSMAEMVDKELLHYIEAAASILQPIKDTYVLKKENGTKFSSYSYALSVFLLFESLKNEDLSKGEMM
jgi:hypothetical protein